MKKEAEAKQSDEALAFTNLAKHLLAVPKKEVDKEKAKYDKGREKEKRSK
jgi:hypothetical protein